MQSNAKPANVQFVTAYGEKKKVSCHFSGPGRTKQSFKDECDINKILDRYRKTGTLDFQQKHSPQYGDVTAFDFQDAVFLIAKANSMFAAMPAHLRTRFDNDPAKFLAFVNDGRNRNEAEELGLLKVKPEAPEKAAGAAVPGPQANPTAEGGTPPRHRHQKGLIGLFNPPPGHRGEGRGGGSEQLST